MKPRIMLGLVALSVIWGSTWMAIRVLVVAVPPMHSASLRFLLASVILLPIIQWKKLPWPTGRGLHATLLLSLSMIAVPSALTFWSEQRLSSGLTALIFGAMPLMTACLTPLMAGRSVPRRAWEAMIVGLGGLGLVMSGAISTSLWQAVGAVAVLLAVAMYAASSVYAKEALAGVHPFVSTAIQFFFGRHLVSACQHGIRARPTFNMEHAGNCRAGVPERLRKRIEFHSVLLAAATD